MPDLAEIRDGWDAAARDDAMFFILTDPAKANGGWEPDDFFAHGQREIDAAMERVTVKKGRALDFGCGVGRLTQALANHFKRVDGVDISPEMVDRARSHNQHPGRVEYHLNTDRIPFRGGTFDFVYSMIVLQHMPADLTERYVGEFVRVLKPGGVCLFQLPEGAACSQPQPWLSMWTAPPETVKGWLERADAEVLSVDVSYASGEGFKGWEYVARKAAR